ncbi:MAG: hypothetical protein ACRDJM_02365, partial [Actinomycetota bacterium]
MRTSLRTTLVVAGCGVGFDLAVNGQAPGASAPLFVTILAAAMRATTPRSSSRERDGLLGAAVLFSGFLAFRDDEALVSLNLLTTAALLALASTGPGVARLHTRALLRRGAALMRAAIGAPAF